MATCCFWAMTVCAARKLRCSWSGLRSESCVPLTAWDSVKIPALALSIFGPAHSITLDTCSIGTPLRSVRLRSLDDPVQNEGCHRGPAVRPSPRPPERNRARSALSVTKVDSDSGHVHHRGKICSI
ncbi:hypothetical protein EJ03DRAFT_199188 [Teratosphaeria nubilosa]|uniref:Uncharacterized protein n=1 Tax=Teratosphaeria nubilosa TaxID=161662 RepID=A0A6G1KYD3_9PEZI|nr:hypothetical protein EJ03DRAFT_199188 [Teratosphaeria nubilosa]